MLPVLFAMTPLIPINIYQCFAKPYDLIFKLEVELTVSYRRRQ